MVVVSGCCRRCEAVFQGHDWLKGTRLSRQVQAPVSDGSALTRAPILVSVVEVKRS